MNVLKSVCLAGVIAALPFAANANLIINGSFEAPDIPTGTFAVFAIIPGWSTSTGPGIEIQDHVAGSPFLGDQFVELDSFSNSGMIQTIIPTVAGQGYGLSFAYSPRPGISTASNPVQVFFNGILLDTLTASGSGLTDTSWAVHSYLVSATGASSTLEFRAVGTSDSLGGYLDDVRFAAPEPAGVALVAAGLLGLALVRRRVQPTHRRSDARAGA